MNNVLEKNVENYNNIYQINFTSSILSYLTFPGAQNVDFIVILVDPHRDNWYTEVNIQIILVYFLILFFVTG